MPNLFKKNPLKHKKQGFTLLELLVVIVIIGLLASIAAPKLFMQIGKSETKTADAQIASLGLALDQYRIDVGQYPSTEQGLISLNKNPGNVPKWHGSYLKKTIPNDPWGKPYQYKSPGDHGDYDLFTLGKDGQLGGTEESTDVVNW